MKLFDVQQAQASLAASEAEGVKWRAFFTLAITTGLRLGEVLGLRWVDVDLDARVLRVQQNIQRVKGQGLIAMAPKTGGSRRPVDLGQDVVALLRKHRADQTAQRLQMGPLWKDQGLVFPSETGSPLEPSRVHRVFTRTCEAAGVPRIRPYDLRHTAATLMGGNQVPLKVISERLGHSDVSLTLRTYSHVFPTLQASAADTMDCLLRTGSTKV